MIPKFLTFFSLWHVCGKKVHYHCRIPKGYSHVPVKGEGHDGLFCKRKDEIKSCLCLKSLRKPIDVAARISEILSSQTDEEFTFIDEGTDGNYHYLKTQQKINNNESDLVYLSYFFPGSDYHIEFSFCADSKHFQDRINDFFVFLESVEIHEKGKR
jgi:hypothetical protein